MNPVSCIPDATLASRPVSGSDDRLSDSIFILQPAAGQWIQYQRSVSGVTASFHAIEVAPSFCLLAYGTGLYPAMKKPIIPDIFLEAQDEGGFVAFSREYAGAAGQGETEEEALKDLEEAIELLKEVLEDRGKK